MDEYIFFSGGFHKFIFIVKAENEDIAKNKAREILKTRKAKEENKKNIYDKFKAA